MNMDPVAETYHVKKISRLWTISKIMLKFIAF
jgi:hypothetical protein